MLSPGTHHQLIPKSLISNLEMRIAVLEAAERDADLQRGLIQMCREDLLFFINLFVWQTDPTQGENLRVGPFITWPFQERVLLDRPETTGRKGLLWCVENKVPMVWPKSRKMGATWLMMIVEDWLCGFHPYFQALNISKSAVAVDDKSMNSLFAKVRFMHAKMPSWLLGEVDDTKRMFFGYGRETSELAGEASSKRAGVGGRGGFVGVDEAAEIEELREVKEKLVGTAPFRLYVSTHLSTGNEFYNIATDPAYVKREMHWTQHPEKNQGLYSFDVHANKHRWWKYDDTTDEVVEIPTPEYEYPKEYEFDTSGYPTGGPFPGIRSPWYDKEAKEIGDVRGVATQVDINPSGSDSQFYNPLVIRELQTKCQQPFLEGDLVYDRETGEPKEFVRRKGGLLKLWINLREGRPPPSDYDIGLDVALGNGPTASNSCVSIGDARTGLKVAEYIDNSIDPNQLGVLAVALGRWFANEDGTGAMVCWEDVGPGTTTGNRIWRDLHYMQVFQPDYEHSMKSKKSARPGLKLNNSKQKLDLHLEYKSALLNGLFRNMSVRALDECLSFRHTVDGGIEHVRIRTADPSGSGMSHGDIVVADSICWKLMKARGNFALAKVKEEVLDVTTLAGRRHERDLQKREMELMY